MSDNTFSNIMSASAAASASEAASEARKARQVAEERLEGSGVNPFVTLDIREFEDVEVPLAKGEQRGFFSQLFNTTPTKRKLAEKGRKVSVKRTDISYLEEDVDDFGTPYTIVNLESRCDLEYSSVEIPGTLEENQLKLNGGQNG